MKTKFQTINLYKKECQKIVKTFVPSIFDMQFTQKSESRDLQLAHARLHMIFLDKSKTKL